MLAMIWNQRMIFLSVAAFMLPCFCRSKLKTHGLSPSLKNDEFTERKMVFTDDGILKKVAL